VNTALMRAQLDDVRRRGEVAASLYASEAGIYGRFGYGIATFDASIDIETARSGFVGGDAVSGAVELLDREEALPRIRPILDEAVAARPGSIAVDDAWFARSYQQTESERKDEPYFFAVHRDDEGRDDAYAVYRVQHDWSGDIPNQRLKAREVQGRTPDGVAAIWRFLFDVDLVRRVTAGARPPDDPLLDLLVEPRRLNLKLRDGMFLRLLDVPAVMAARRFAVDGHLVFDVADPFIPELEGRFELAVRDGTAECAPTREPADLSCSVVELGATYLGGSSFRRLARARRVRELRAGALARADAMFAWDPAPWCALHF
jgi:predicted acetyltransferase